MIIITIIINIIIIHFVVVFLYLAMILFSKFAQKILNTG